MTHQIVIVDDNPLTSLGIRSVIDAAPGMSVCGSTVRGAAAVLEVAISRPHVAVLCMTDADDECFGDVAALSSMVPVLLVTTDEHEVTEAFRRGATGCLMYRDTTPDRLVSAVSAVASGQAYVSADLMHAVMSGPEVLTDVRSTIKLLDGGDSVPPARIAPGLTQRECEVMDLVSIGLSNDQIASRLFLSQKTVRNYLSHAYAVLGVSSRTQAALSWRVEREPTAPTPA